ncbi:MULTISPECIES: chorismate mutase [Rhizobium]|uniref:chorismate mutase n=1 Tax=Rhizobium TaxID=379 RepID=UPI0013BBA2C0|nr:MULTISPECIES: chorismate mutase [Rhizobium]MBY3321505.1 chorismate mutase [Rhizobium laguerreae]MBY3362781.1 chorismate mutase [Rhizobium laguerreae]MCA2436660.1 chorismate mutase [Rhizobium leguminosarum]NEH73496.1 chorismate mutase [Rhizobium leguminosarum]NKM67641.1 chorismate mutase [Rhizobium laguerreae]
MNDAEIVTQLSNHRRTIDNLDAALVRILAERFRATTQVGILKATYDLPAKDEGREALQVERLRRHAEEAEMDPDFAEKLLNFIIDEVVQRHKKIASDAKTAA